MEFRFQRLPSGQETVSGRCRSCPTLGVASCRAISDADLRGIWAPWRLLAGQLATISASLGGFDPIAEIDLTQKAELAAKARKDRENGKMMRVTEL